MKLVLFPAAIAKAAALLFILSSCQKDTLPNLKEDELQQIEAASLRAPATPSPILVTAIDDYELNETTLTSAGWTKTFEDNFDNASLDLTKWNSWNSGAYNNELQYYSANNLQVANGVLTIAAKKETVTGATNPYDPTPKKFDYTSGRIETRTLFSANNTTPKVRIAARMKLAPGYGMWSAFWSYGDPWPTQGEIDIVEARGQEPNKFQTNYFYGKTANRNLVRNQEGYIQADKDLTAHFHVYEVVWEKNTFTYYLDGNVIEIKSGGYIPSIFGKSEKVALNLAVGGVFFSNLNLSQIQPGTLSIDWVKVFTSK